MPYYPKNKVSPNQYTQGNEYVFASSGNDYTGYYYKAFDGKFFTGKTPTYKDFELVPKHNNITELKEYTDILTNKNNRIFNVLKPNANSTKQALPVQSSIINPSSEDYTNGLFTRYFAKRINTNPITIFEIDEQTYDDLSLQSPKYNFALYDVISLSWQISGQLETTTENGIITRGVRQVNMETVQQANLVFIGIDQYLTDYTEFYQ
jgi:hypothetical protein